MRMLAEDYICFYETEADIWWSNITEKSKQVIIDGGIRWFEAAQGHIMGENIMNLRNGQVAGRTAKTQRDLEESFFSPSRAVIIYGGAKRIFFINLFSCVAGPLEYKELFIKGFRKMIEVIEPIQILMNGKLPEELKEYESLCVFIKTNQEITRERVATKGVNQND